jgi:hypothetical protein
LNDALSRVTLPHVEREGLFSTRLFVAASFIVFCMLAVAFLGVSA